MLLIPRPLDADGAGLSGVDRHLHELCRNLSDRVEYVYLGDTPEVVSMERSADAPSAQAKAPSGRRRILPGSVALLLGYLHDARKLSREMRPLRSKVDLVHVMMAGCEPQNIAAKMAGFPRRLSTVHAMHGTEEAAQHWVRCMVERLSFASIQHHIVVSNSTWEDWHGRIGLARSRATTVYNGMDPGYLAGFDARAYRLKVYGADADMFVIGCCARLHWMKGLNNLVKAFAALLREGMATMPAGMDPLLVLVGDGPERGELERLCGQLGIAGKVRFLGHRTDGPRLVAGMDIHVMPSVAIETLGYSNIEAMFAAVPAIVSDVGGAKEIIQASGGGIVAKAGDVEGITESIRRLAGSAELRRSMGERGRKYAYENLTAKHMADKTYEVYLKVLGRDAALGGNGKPGGGCRNCPAMERLAP